MSIMSILKKSLSILLSITCISAVTFNFQKAIAVDNISLKFESMSEYVTAYYDTLSKDMEIPVTIYCDAPKNELFTNANVKLKCSDDKYMSLKNISNPKDQIYSTAIEYKYSGGSFKTVNAPMCFGNVSGGKYNVNTYLTETNKYLTLSAEHNPIDGTRLRADGKGGIYFKVNNVRYCEGGELENLTYASNPEAVGLTEDSSNYRKIRTTTDENGNLKIQYKYIDQSTFNEKTATFTVRNFDNTLSKDEYVAGNSDEYMWINNSGAKLLGNANEIPLLQVTLVLKKGAPIGKYSISIDESNTYFTNKSGKKYSMSNSDLSYIAANVNVISKDDYSSVYSLIDIAKEHYYTTEKGIYIRATDFVKSVKRKDTYLGKTTILDVTNDVTFEEIDASKQLPKLFVENGYTYSEVIIPYLCNGSNIYDPSGNLVTSKALVGLKGDVNLDGKVDSKDATKILKFYAQKLTGSSPNLIENSELENFAYFLGDANGESQNHGGDGSTLDSKDATSILKYYSGQIAGSNLSWNDIIK